MTFLTSGKYRFNRAPNCSKRMPNWLGLDINEFTHILWPSSYRVILHSRDVSKSAVKSNHPRNLSRVQIETGFFWLSWFSHKPYVVPVLVYLCYLLHAKILAPNSIESFKSWVIHCWSKSVLVIVFRWKKLSIMGDIVD